ncbi:MAG TPA: alpha/beta hydrolase [Ilumatobacteraceae bacterium]|nr:alpha/beta hydrolase [Ilumatobacteraceae bacterium]
MNGTCDQPFGADHLHVEHHGQLSIGTAPVVMVHGSWTDGTTWRMVVPDLAPDHLVVTYDRRGHSRSPWPHPVTRRQDEDDLIEIIERLGAGPVHLISSSYGGAITLTVAARRPELVCSVTAHEPALFGVARPGTSLGGLIDDIRRWMVSVVGRELAAGRHEAGAQRFFDEVLGAGAWEALPAGFRAAIAANAHTFAGMLEDPSWDQLTASPDPSVPVMLTKGTTSPVWLTGVVDQLAASVYAHASCRTIHGAGHSPHLTHPAEFGATLRAFVTVR